MRIQIYCFQIDDFLCTLSIPTLRFFNTNQLRRILKIEEIPQKKAAKRKQNEIANIICDELHNSIRSVPAHLSAALSGYYVLPHD